MWTVGFGLGLCSSPFRLIVRRGVEVRPDLAVAIADLHRVGCESCEFEITRKSQPSSALGVRAQAGLDIYIGRRRRTGLAVAAMYQRAVMNPDGALADPLAEFDTRIESPTWWLRVSLLRRGRAFAAY